MRRSTGSGSYKKSPPPTETEQRTHLFLDPSKPQSHHNHAIPCDSLLHKIATSLLPKQQEQNSQVSNESLTSSKEKELESLRPHQRAAVLAATSSTSSSTSTVSPANNSSTSQQETNNQSTASPWTQVVQSILWKEFGTLQDETATNTTSNANSNSATNSNNKKRKKKKKKKKVPATESIHEEEQPTDSPTTAATDTSTKDALDDEPPKSSEQPTEPNHSPKNNNSSSPPLDFSVLPQDCPKVFPHYRDWWIHFYLDRANRQQNNNPHSNNSSHGHDLSEFLQIIAQKTRIAHSETTTTNNNNTNPPSSKKNKKSKGTSATASSSSKPWFVPHAAVDEAINDIQCFHCRKAVRNLINSVTCLPLQALDQYRLSGGYRHYPANHFANVHTSNTFVDDNDDNPEPFDYVAMEEGNAVVQSETSSPLVSDPVSDIWALVAVPNEQTGETQGWRLQKVPKGVTTTSQPRLETLTITKADFTFLLRECYLLPAISYDMWVGAQPFTNEQDSRKDEEGQELYQAIVDKVQERHQDIMTNNNITPNRTKCLELFHKLANVPYPTDAEMQKRETADTKATVMLNDVNAEITAIVNSMLQLLLQLTRAYQSILTHWNYYHAQQLSSESNTATPTWLPFPSYLLKQVSTIVALWKTYLKCMQIMMDAVHDYEQAIFELADGRGTIKQIMFNPQMRRLLHTQLEIKLNACLEMIDEIRVQLDEQKDAYETPHFVYKPTFLRSILTQQAFLEVVVGNTAKYKNTELVGMNDACEDVLTELGQSWGFSEHRRNVTDFHEWHGQRRARMQRQLNTASILLQVYHDKACVSDNDNLPVLSNFLAKIDEEVSMDEAEPILRKNLLSTIENLIRAWMVSSTKALPKETTKTANGEPASRPGMQLGPKKTPAPASSKDDSTVPFIMPLQLIEWSACCHEAGPSKKILPGYCHAPDGSRRAANMLMAFMYDWLDDQFNEWQAEKAEQELLSGVDQMLEDDLAASGAPTGKKKSKKKKNKKAADITSPDMTLVVSKGDDTSTDNGLDPKDGKTSDKDEDESAVVPIVTAEPLDGVTTTTITTTVVTTTTTITTTNHPKQGTDTSAEPLSKETVARKSIQESTPAEIEESAAATPETADNTPAVTKGKNKKKKKSKATATTAAQPSKPAPVSVEETTTDTTKNPPRKQPKTKSGKKQADTVMIQDGSSRIKARTFLFQRMEANFGKGDKNVDSDGYPMVHIS